MNMAREVARKYQIVEEPESGTMEMAWVDVSGAELDPKQVRRVRAEEVEYAHKMNMYEEVLATECYNKTGGSPIIARWVDISKEDDLGPNYRSRFAAREINASKRNDLSAAAPPLEALKMIRSMTPTANKCEITMLNGISRAFWHARVIRDLYVQLPDEGGTRGAAQHWRQERSHWTWDSSKGWHIHEHFTAQTGRQGHTCTEMIM